MPDLAGDGFFFVTVQRNQRKDWVKRLFVPYAVFFALSCLISVVSMIVKIQIIRQKFSRHEAAAAMVAAESMSPTPRPLQSIAAKPIEESAGPPQVARTQSKVAELEAKVLGMIRHVTETALNRHVWWGT